MKQRDNADINQAVERIREQVEMPVLSSRQVTLLNSGYINSADEVLEVLESAEQEKGVEIPKGSL